VIILRRPRRARACWLPFDEQCVRVGLPRPIPEFPFAKTEGRRWRIDWVFRESRIALEVEGGYSINGRHTRAAGFLRDLEKYNTLACYGFRLLRVTPRQIANGHALAWVQRILQ
jgi:hypothetical protein